MIQLILWKQFLSVREDLPLEEFRENTIIREEFEGNWNKQGRIWGNLKN